MEITSSLNLTPRVTAGKLWSRTTVTMCVAFIPYNWLVSTTYVPEVVT
jgi:hypothetical protein